MDIIHLSIFSDLNQFRSAWIVEQLVVSVEYVSIVIIDIRAYGNRVCT